VVDEAYQQTQATMVNQCMLDHVIALFSSFVMNSSHDSICFGVEVFY
jgi:hypothetical protein